MGAFLLAVDCSLPFALAHVVFSPAEASLPLDVHGPQDNVSCFPAPAQVFCEPGEAMRPLAAGAFIERGRIRQDRKSNHTSETPSNRQHVCV